MLAGRAKTKPRRTVGAIALASAAIGLGVSAAAPAVVHPSEDQARQVVRQFFDTLNARQFTKTCDLMSTRFFRENRVPAKRRCVLGLAATFTMTATVHVRILDVRSERDRTVVRAVANGVPGLIVLVEEGDRLKILSVGA